MTDQVPEQELLISVNGTPIKAFLQLLSSGFTQVNVYAPGTRGKNGPGAGFFVVAENRAVAIDGAKAAIKLGGLEPEQDITHLVPGAVVAATMPYPKVQFGVPHVAYAEDLQDESQ